MPAALLSHLLTTLITSFSSLKIWLYVAAAIAPFVTYGWATVKTRYEVRTQERAACTARIAEVEKRINEAAQKQVEEARRAAEEVAPTPATPAELVRLCQQSRDCRDRIRKQ